MIDINKITNEIVTIVTKEGYAPQLDYSIKLSGYDIYKYNFIVADKYKLGVIRPQGLLSIIPKIIYDGIAYKQYMVWEQDETKNYYFFRRKYARVLDYTYATMSIEAIGKIDKLIVYEFFNRITSRCCSMVEDDSGLKGNFNIQEDSQALVILLKKMHVLGNSIFSCWREGKSPRFRFVETIIDPSFRPHSIVY